MRRAETFVLVLLAAACAALAEEPQVEVHGAAWFECGRIQHATDTMTYLNYNGNWKQTGGALLSAAVSIGPRISGGVGFGAFLNISTHGSGGSAMSQMFNKIEPFLAEAQLTVTLGDLEKKPVMLTGGFFPYRYNRNVRNLGLYLLRGPVYPGFLYSGFEAFATIDVATFAGALAQTTLFDVWKNDLIFYSEVEHKPYFDFSLAYLTRVTIAKSIEVGAGVNFYRLISVNDGLTTPGKTLTETGNQFNAWEANYIYVDTAGSAGDTAQWDTTNYTFRGTKLGGHIAFDVKKLLSTDIFGPNDLVLYGEAAVIGLKNYPVIYSNIAERIPVMVGFNVPTFKLLDVLSLEAEYYGAKYRNDATNLDKYQSYSSPIPARTKLSQRSDTSYDVNADNWKWSVYASRTVNDCIKFSGQVASDHSRTSGNARGSGGMEETLITLKDWYWMMKMTFFF
jgi:hypothetical protein